MAVIFYIFLILGLHNENLPYLADENYNYEIKYSFKKRPAPDPNTYDVSNSLPDYSSTPLPYVEMIITCVFDDNMPFKYHVDDNKNGTIRRKKFKSNKEVIELDFGYADDIKDRTGPHKFEVIFIDEDKNPQSRIEIEFNEEGDMFINGEKRGKI